MAHPTGERRKGSRVLINGNMHWHCGRRVGEGRIIDISPRGASFEALADEAPVVGQILRLHIDLDNQLEWRISDDARVVRRKQAVSDACQVAVAFLRQQK